MAPTLPVFFFFQAEDGIRDYKVTGVQTCALPISSGVRLFHSAPRDRRDISRKLNLWAIVCSSSLRRSSFFSGFFHSGSSRIRITSSTVFLTASVAGPTAAIAPNSPPPTKPPIKIAAQKVLYRCIPSLLFTVSMADRTTNSLDVAMNKLSDQRLQIHTRFGVADLASRSQLFLGSPRRDRHVLVADQPAGLDRRDGVTIQLDARLDYEGHERAFAIERDPLHMADRHPRNLHGRARLEPGDGIEFRLNLHLLAAPDDFKLAELDCQVRQGGDPDQHEDAHDHLELRVAHGYWASLPTPEAAASDLGPTLMNSRTAGCRVR